MYMYIVHRTCMCVYMSSCYMYKLMYMYMYIVPSVPSSLKCIPPPHTVDIRRVVLPGGASVAVVVRAGEAYLLKVELSSILPSHSRDVLETIRRVSLFQSSYKSYFLLDFHSHNMCTIYICTCSCTQYHSYVHVHVHNIICTCSCTQYHSYVHVHVHNIICTCTYKMYV